MNADPTDTRSSHLDLEDLIAAATGQATDGRTREHLARCEHCRAEANRWKLVADGVAAATAEVTQPARPLHAGPHALAGPGRRTMMAAGAAAALVLVGGAGYWAAAALVGHAPGTRLTAVSGCAAVEQASGTLEQVNGRNLVIKTASGQPVTVTTTASTELGVSGPLLSGIPDGTSVTVSGPGSGGTIAAMIVSVRPPSGVQAPPGFVTVKGTVSGTSTAGFTVVTSGATRVPVTTSSLTVVNVFHVSPGQLPAGATITAIGHAGPDGTLRATAAMVVLPRPSGPHIHVHANATPHGCSLASLAGALARALFSGG
jgi:anti-sigma factor RsiW